MSSILKTDIFATTDVRLITDDRSRAGDHYNYAWWSGKGISQRIAGVLIPFLPEARSTDASRGMRSDVQAQKLSDFIDEFQRVIQALSDPNTLASFGDLLRPIYTYDLRICKTTFTANGEFNANAPLKILILVKGIVFAGFGGRNYDETDRYLDRDISEILNRLCQLLPNDVNYKIISWVPNRSSNDKTPLRVRDEHELSPEEVGIGSPTTVGLRFNVEVRRSTVLNADYYPHDLENLDNIIGRDYFREYSKNPNFFVDCNYSNNNLQREYALPQPWFSFPSDFLGVCKALYASSQPIVFSVRVHPTLLTRAEKIGIKEILKRYKPKDGADKSVFKNEAFPLALERLEKLLSSRRLYQVITQVASDSRENALTVANAYIAERRPMDRLLTDDFRASLVFPLCVVENNIAKYNMRYLDFLPWGAAGNFFLTRETAKGSIDGLSLPDNLPPLGYKYFEVDQTADQNVTQLYLSNYLTDSILKALDRPSVFVDRDQEFDPRLKRLRYLATESELAGIWRLPLPPPGGFLGLTSKRPNPFEQIPAQTPANGDAVSLGKVQIRGVDSDAEFRVPFAPWTDDKKVFGVAGLGDRSIVVAGSPGSGKTNFCISFLRQIAGLLPETSPNAKRDRPCPFLVIDPTRGNEFRSLMNRELNKTEPTRNVLTFTVGDSRYPYNSFCFNPFQVPPGVSVQSHICRMLSCFKAAYEMWDPLPAIFDMALRLAYEKRRRDWWEEKEIKAGRSSRAWSPSFDFPECANEPFPNLKDVMEAMGKGDEEEPYYTHKSEEPKYSVMHDQKAMWGGTTENAHTIVASTYLRLKNIFDNYDDVIGGAKPGRPSVDLKKLLEHPAILEFGSIGDSQALALIMSFFISALAGYIEGRGTPKEGRRHMLVLEEAHRLLEGGGGSGKSGNSKAQAAEDINNMLAEVRKYGQGVMIIDQRPGSLIGGVIDNAYMVMLHRLNEEKGFAQFSNQLNLNPDQQAYVRSELMPGQMVALDRRTGTPVLLRPANENTDAEKRTDELINEWMKDRVQYVYSNTTDEKSSSENPFESKNKAGESNDGELMNIIKARLDEFNANPVKESACSLLKSVLQFYNSLRGENVLINAPDKEIARVFKSVFSAQRKTRFEIDANTEGLFDRIKQLL